MNNNNNHRQTAAASADAVEPSLTAFDTAYRIWNDHTNTAELAKQHKVFDANAAASLIQAYGDACRLDGARKMQEAALNHIKLVWKNFGDPAYHGKGNSIMGGFEERFACNQCETAMAALSPETVCGGE